MTRMDTAPIQRMHGWLAVGAIDRPLWRWLLGGGHLALQCAALSLLRAIRPVLVFTAFIFVATVLVAVPVHVRSPDPLVMEPSVVIGREFTRFVVLGDQGKGNEKQFAVGRAIATVCGDRGGCDFAVTVGDNFYPSGVTGVDDPKWETHFQEPYRALDFPFRASLGNHDYGANGIAWEVWLAEHQVAYSRLDAKWRMPAKVYGFSEGPVDFLLLDTTPLSFGIESNQAEALELFFETSERPWQIVVGHHPYLSNGKHANAGEYDQVPYFGHGFKKFLEENVCGKAQVYLAGHDHNLQDLVMPESCRTELVVSGAGSSTTRLRGENPVHFQSDASGFVLVEATPAELTVSFFDEHAKALHSRVIRRESFSVASP